MSPTTSSDPKQVIRNLYSAFAAGDVQAVLGSFAGNLVWNEAENFIYADRNPYRGPQAVLEGIFLRLAAEWDGFTVTPELFVSEGHHVVVCGRYRGTLKSSRTAVDAQFVHVWTVQDGKVTTFQQYTDTLQFARAVGA